MKQRIARPERNRAYAVQRKQRRKWPGSRVLIVDIGCNPLERKSTFCIGLQQEVTVMSKQTDHTERQAGPSPVHQGAYTVYTHSIGTKIKSAVLKEMILKEYRIGTSGAP